VERVNWILLAQDKGQWRDLVNTVMKLRLLWKAGNSVTAEWIFASEEGIHSMKLVNYLCLIKIIYFRKLNSVDFSWDDTSFQYALLKGYFLLTLTKLVLENCIG
jgi:hypothetical protein